MLYDVARITVEALLNSLWQGMVLVGLVGITLKLKPSNATTRYLIYWATLIAVGVLPFVAGLVPAVPLNINLPAPSVPSLKLYLGPLTIVLFVVWLCVAGYKLVRLGWCYSLLQGLKHRSHPLTDHHHHLKQWLNIYGKGRPVKLCGSIETTVPMAVGLRNPVILMPAQLLHQLTPAEFDQVGLHELGHLRRWDDWTNLGQKILEALFFFHPAVGWLGQQLNLEREIACDDGVIALTGAPRPYAHCLTRLVELTFYPAPNLLISQAVSERKHLTRRVELLLDKSRDTTPHLSKIGFLVVVDVLILLVIQCAQVSPVIALPQEAPPPIYKN